MPETTLEHWPTERMIQEGHSDYATPEDLQGLDDDLLIDIAQICEVDEFAPDECIPCLAHVTVLERRQAEIEEKVDGLRPPEIVRQESYSTTAPEFTIPDDLILTGKHNEIAPEAAVTNMSNIPVAERFASHVAVLHSLVEEMLQGPPIPPPDVTTEELAALVVGAKKWVAMIDAQGLELAPSQEAVKNEIVRVLQKVQRS